MKTLHLIDTSAIMRTYHENTSMMNLSCMVDGEIIPTKALYGIFSLFKIIPLTDTIVFAADRKSSRKDLDESYKANRTEADIDYRVQVLIAEQVLQDSGFNLIFRDGFEADDILASLARKYKDKYDKVYIYSNDYDTAALIEDNVAMVNTRLRNTVIDRDNFINYLGYPFNLRVLYKATVGKKADNVPGVFRFGDGAFSKLVDYVGTKYNYAEVRINNLEEQIIREYFAGDKLEQALNSLRLSLPMYSDEFCIEEKEVNKDILKRELSKYQMNSILRAIG